MPFWGRGELGLGQEGREAGLRSGHYASSKPCLIGTSNGGQSLRRPIGDAAVLHQGRKSLLSHGSMAAVPILMLDSVQSSQCSLPNPAQN